MSSPGKSNCRRTHVVIPEEVVAAIDAAAGAWKRKHHPELEGDSAAWVRSLRSEGERLPVGATPKRR